MGDALNKILNCRRSIVSIFAIACLTALGFYGINHGFTDISGLAMSVAGICGALSGANAFEGARNGKTDGIPVKLATKPTLKPDNPD